MRRLHYSANWAHSLKKKYKITPNIYYELLKAQNYGCAICQVHEIKLKHQLAVDHNHLTDKIRGLLCSNCNTGLGLFEDKAELLQKAIAYLNK